MSWSSLMPAWRFGGSEGLSNKPDWPRAELFLGILVVERPTMSCDLSYRATSLHSLPYAASGALLNLLRRHRLGGAELNQLETT